MTSVGSEPREKLYNECGRSVACRDAAVVAHDVCGEVRGLISNMRSDGYLAIRIDELVEFVNAALRVAAEEGGQKVVEITVEDVKRCLKYDDTVRVIGGGNGGEALWLWGGSYMFMLADRAAKAAAKYGAVLMEAEKAYGG
jgi:hypothetical protein